MIADMIKRGWSRSDIMQSPLSQLMLEWDAAQFNEFCTDYADAVAQFKHTLQELTRAKSPDTKKISELTAKRDGMRDEFNKRQYLFWHGKELEL